MILSKQLLLGVVSKLISNNHSMSNQTLLAVIIVEQVIAEIL